jgi:hypothetical protein
MSDLSSASYFEGRPEGGALGPLCEVLRQSKAMLRIAKQEEPSPATAQVTEAGSETFEDDMRHVQSVFQRALMYLGYIEMNMWNLSVRQSIAELGQGLKRDLNQVYERDYPHIFRRVMNEIEAVEGVPAPPSVEYVLDTFLERLVTIYMGWREANPCLRSHRPEDKEVVEPQ